jgi:hypothetical protein
MVSMVSPSLHWQEVDPRPNRDGLAIGFTAQALGACVLISSSRETKNETYVFMYINVTQIHEYCINIVKYILVVPQFNICSVLDPTEAELNRAALELGCDQDPEDWPLHRKAIPQTALEMPRPGFGLCRC